MCQKRPGFLCKSESDFLIRLSSTKSTFKSLKLAIGSSNLTEYHSLNNLDDSFKSKFNLKSSTTMITSKICSFLPKILLSGLSHRNLRSESVVKCSTYQSFTRTESPSYRIATLVLKLQKYF